MAITTLLELTNADISLPDEVSLTCRNNTHICEHANIPDDIVPVVVHHFSFVRLLSASREAMIWY